MSQRLAVVNTRTRSLHRSCNTASMRRRDQKTDKMLKLDESESENVPKKRGRPRKNAEESKSNGHRKSKYANGSGRKLRSSIKALPHKVEPEEKETPMDLLYLTKDPSGVSCKIEPSVSNEDNYILMPPLQTLEDSAVRVEELFEQSIHKISKNQKNSRWKHSYNKMVYLRKYETNSDQSMQDETSQSTSSEEHERIPKIEDITYDNLEKIKRDKKWVKKVNPLSLHYTDKRRPYLKCPACGATFFSPNTYQRHLLSHLHMTAENYTCNFCNYSNAEPGMLFAHLTKHQDQCESCNESLLRKDNYEKHYQYSTNFLECGLKRDHHGMFACAVCELVFDLIAQLEKHWFKHTCKKQKLHQCNECSGIYANLDTLKNHICLKCPICGEVYENLHRLKVHTMWTKHNLKCPICSYEFILSMDHEKHMALHRKVYQPIKDYTNCLRAADGKTFQCNLCDKIFYTLRALLTHLMEEHNVGNVVKVEEEVIMGENSYELKGDAIDIVVVPDFKSDSYCDNEIDPLQQETDPLRQETDPLQQETDLYNPS